MTRKTRSKRKQNKVNGANSGHVAAAIFAGFGFSLLLIYLFAAFYYNNHFFGKTIINGIKTSNMTVSKAEEAINAEVKAYRLTLLERNDLKEFIDGKDIKLHTEFEQGLNELLKKQNKFAWPVSLFHARKFEINTMIAYDKDLLKQKFDALNIFNKESIIEPENASISEYGDNGFTIVPENKGTKVIPDKLFGEVSKAIDNLSPKLSIEKTDCYENPTLTSDSPKLISALANMNKIAGTVITYQFGSDTEILDGSKISKWLSLDKNYKVHVDVNGIKEFVDYIGKTYNSFGRIRTFKTTYGNEVKVEGGDYGWWLNRPEEVAALKKLIVKGDKINREPVYFQTAQQFGKDDIGNTYVEINLTAQHLFFYYEGKKILETDVVTGNVSKNLGTPVGTYPIQYKENDATLVGEDYETPVKYWMPFNKNIGLHDAYWRSEFGKDIYLTRGSHGCINMPPAAAKKVFKYIKRGVPVVVYKLPGTENYATDKNKSNSKASVKKSNTAKPKQNE